MQGPIYTKCLRQPSDNAFDSILIENNTVVQLLFLKKIWRTWVLFVGSLIPCFGLLVMSPLGFKARVGSLIRTWQRHACYMFPEIHIWCDTCWPLSVQHGSQANLFHIPATRHWWGSNGRVITPQANALPTELCQPATMELLENGLQPQSGVTLLFFNGSRIAMAIKRVITALTLTHDVNGPKPWPTGMHSSRMRTARSLTISHSICHVHPPATRPSCHTCPPTMNAPHHACPLPHTPPTMHAPPPCMPLCHAHPAPTTHAPPCHGRPPCGQNSWQTLLKILPCPKLRLRAVTKALTILIDDLYDPWWEAVS